ncbi:uncharacterized protein LOC121865937 [Homarus americanus]|uniref:uncharacterized protein LOC121865937 n=1 Tax=Homarus americanus TaxID=6706 RepID=UPI001C48B37F|nr:uncharacterized protein LOC121865937 [Homarus americanus]
MKIWQPERCCGSSLRTGSLVVGSLALVGAVLDIINGCAGTLAVVVSMFGRLKIISCLKDVESEECQYDTSHSAVYFAVALLLAESIQVIACSMLIYGIYKERHRLMLPYILWSCVRLATFLAFSVCVVVLYFYMPLVILILLSAVFLLAAVEAIYILIIRSQYLKMRQAQSDVHVILEEESADL